jgi:RNA polymerase subunit RPABC4/transcription elongation factor Spt4
LCEECIKVLRQADKKCPVCKERVLLAQYHGLTDTFKLYKKMSTIVTDQAAIATANSSRTRVTRWVQRSMEKEMPQGQEEEKGEPMS